MKVQDLNDTIAAISTPLGEGGIGIVRLSGTKSLPTALKIFKAKNQTKVFQSHRLYYGNIIDPIDDSIVDESLLSYMKAPSSYTMEDVVEINCHGGSLVLQRVMEIVMREGIREASPGEFSKRAFLNGRIDLTQAEAVIDIIRAKTEGGLRLANRQLNGGLREALKDIKDDLVYVKAVTEAYIDFPEDDIDEASFKKLVRKTVGAIDFLGNILDTYDEGKLYREGIHVVIAGRPNVGKSSLLNSLLKEKRAIVTSIPGTTRDIIEEIVNIKGIPVNLIDTAGIRETEDVIEEEGIKMTMKRLGETDLLLYMVDDEGLQLSDIDILKKYGDDRVIIVINKEDIISVEKKRILKDNIMDKRHVFISAKNEIGIDSLKNEIHKAAVRDNVDYLQPVVVSRKRHKIGIEKALVSIKSALKGIETRNPYELVSSDINDALINISDVAGETTTEDVLDKIFGEFCIGK